MKQIFLMRHAKSSWDNPNASDHERTLNNRGNRDAPRMANWLLEQNADIGLILSSDSQRTKETYAHLKISFPNVPVKFERNLYLVSANEILTRINDVDDKYNSVLILAHNPGITYAFELLASTYIDNVPTSGLGKIDFDVRSFADIEAKTGSLVSFMYPKKLS